METMSPGTLCFETQPECDWFK